MVDPTVPDSRPVLDVIAEAAGEVLSRRLGGFGSWGGMTADLAATILAACQGATVAQQAELIGGDVILRHRAHDVVRRAVGEWIEDPS